MLAAQSKHHASDPQLLTSCISYLFCMAISRARFWFDDDFLGGGDQGCGRRLDRAKSSTANHDKNDHPTECVASDLHIKFHLL